MGEHRSPLTKDTSMLIGQITDIHIGFDPGNPDEFNRQRVDDVLARLADNPTPPDLLLATGDLTDKGDEDSYRILAEMFAACPWPVYPCMGNHDIRSAFLDYFPGLADDNGFIQYEVATGPIRLLIIDTLEEGRHGGAFCDLRAEWLHQRLTEQPEVPTYIVMHHPPFESGIEWMTTDPREPWVERFARAIAGADQLHGLICGHLHRSLTVQWQGLTAAVCSSTAPQVSLDLRPIDVNLPDNRPMIVAEDPAYALHYWNNSHLVSYFERAGARDVLASFDQRMQPLVTELKAERPN